MQASWQHEINRMKLTTSLHLSQIAELHHSNCGSIVSFKQKWQHQLLVEIFMFPQEKAAGLRNELL